MMLRLPWKSIHEVLLADGRPWDFRDLFVSALGFLGWEGLGMAIFGMKSSASVIESILYDWKGGLDDDTFTTLSLLDLFTACILESRLGQDRAGRLRSLMRVADHLAESILQQDARLTKSRPYLQWLLSRAALAACMAPGKPLNGHQMPGFAGLLLDVGPGVQLPLYAPYEAEAPPWTAFFRDWTHSWKCGWIAE